ncbi:PAS domain S-box protein [Nodularia sp. UHCC 0506]|uniref:PAS domain S-box protein n=1 Tax=Nodularia sp. UHCC 0506 TaxID=3110243 RepID=UPI002B1EE6E0|nr:PAS domain S-box protein [Nodularia sp. UHCC 0506]MEA5513940.1 PAS domain S-box protein [Nodularia sp. UHCC 0506]
MSSKSFSISDIERIILNSPLKLPAETPVIEAVRFMSQVRETCHLNLALVQSDAEILNHAEQASCILVVKNEKLVGIFTEREIVRCTAMGLNLEQVTLAEVMVKNPVTIKKSQFTNIFVILSLFRQYKISHLTVVDDQNHIVGFITQISILYSLDLLDMYENINFLQQKIYQLEAEKVDILQKQNTKLEMQVQERTLKLIEQANADKLLATFSYKIRNSLDLESILQSAVSEIRGYLQTDRVVIYQFEPEWSGRIVAESLAPEKTSLFGRVIHDPCFGINWVEPYTNGRVRKIEDIYAAGLADCHIELLEKAEIYANLIVPIVYHEQLWGLLCAHQCSQPRCWKTLEVELLEKLSTQIAIAIQQSQLYEQAQKELLKRQRMEEALRNIALGVSTQTGEVFFHSLVQYLSKALAVDYAIVAQLVNNKTDYMETVAVWANGEIVENFECSFLDNPYYNTLRNSHQCVCIYPSQVQREFPLDPKLRDMQAESYMGMPIYDSTGQSIGILAVLSRHPLHDIEFMSEIMKIFSMQVASELQRTQAEVALKKLNEELEIRIAERTAELEQINEDLLLEIQERQRVEQILQKQLTAIEATIDGIAILKDDKYTFLNKSHVQLFGYNDAKELIGKTWQEIYPPEEIQRFQQEVFPILMQEGCWQGEAIARRNDGSIFHEEISLTMTQDGELICVCRDITESKQAELQLQKLLLELSDFKYALDQSAIVAITDSKGKITYANDQFCQISQYSQTELIGSTHKIINSGYHSSEYFQKLWSTITKGQVWRGELKNKAKDGTCYWVDTIIVPFIDKTGKPWQYLAIRNDITNRKKIQSDLQESEQKFRQLAENLNQVFWMTDPETSTMIYISPAYEEIWGCSCQSLYENPKSFIDSIYADDKQPFFMAMQNKKQGFDIEYRIIRPDGSMRWIRDQAFPLTNQMGEVYRIVGIAEDITESKKSTVAIEQSQSFLRQVIDTNPNLIYVKDLQGRFVLANQAFADIYGTTVAELIGKNYTYFNSNADDLAYLNSINQEVITTLKPYIIPEIKIITVTGETRYFQTIKSPLIANDGKAYQILGVLTDITERKRAEQEISKALEREKELGELKSRFVSMTSHEFRTPLTVITSSAGILKDFGHKLDDTKKKKHLDCIQTYVKHTTQLLDDILLINKAETGNLAFEPTPLNLIPFCQQLTEEIELSAPNHKIVFSSHFQGNASGNFDKKLLRQILSNLLSNAIKYSPHNAIVKFELNIKAQNVIFNVQDQGIGIPEADQVKLFESFHRAQNVGNIPGTGLGLSIVAKCIDLHKGSIAVNSQVGMGTTFIVTIPLQSGTFVQKFADNTHK